MPDQTMTQVETPLMNPVQRIVSVFVAPAKTFEDVKRSSGWWVPFLIAMAVGLLFGYVVLHRVGLPTLVDEAIRQSTRTQDQIASSTPEQAARMRTGMGSFITGILYAVPFTTLLVGLMNAGLFLATANFGAGGKAKYGEMLAVWFYGALPMTVFYLLVIVAIFSGAAGDGFNLNNPVGTNVGFYLSGGETPKVLVAVLSSIDIFAIWTMWLLTSGISTVAGIKRGAAAFVVCGWWLVFVLLLRVLPAAFS